MFYNKLVSCLYMFRAHVLIIRRSKLHYTASGIITPVTPIGVMMSKFHYTVSGIITPIGVMIPEAV